jgi:lysophospholipase L1-like esterase
MRLVREGPLRILVFGQSNTGGAQLGGGDVAWPGLVMAALPEIISRPVEITFRPFYAHSPNSQAYLERELQKHDQEIVFLMLTTFSFITPIIERGLHDRLGPRIGQAYGDLARRFDSATRHGRIGAPMNRAVRRVANRLLPAETATSYEVALDGTTKALQRLAREEDRQVVAMHGFVRITKRPSAKSRAVDAFLLEMRSAAERLHLVFINMQRDDLDDRWFLADGQHVTAAAHEAIAAAVLSAFRDGRIRGRE